MIKKAEDVEKEQEDRERRQNRREKRLIWKDKELQGREVAVKEKMAQLGMEDEVKN